MELQTYIGFLRKRWLPIVSLGLLGVLLAAVLTSLATPKFESTTRLFVSTPNAGTSSDLAQGNQFIQQRVQSYSDILTNDRVLQPAIDQLGLPDTPAELASRVRAEAPFNTVLIDITVTDPSPTQAAAIANAIASSFINVVTELERGSGAVGVSPVSLSAVGSAQVPSGPVAPNERLNVAVGLIVGLIAGVGLAALRQALDRRLDGEQGVARAGLAVLGRVPYDPAAAKEPLVLIRAPLSAHAESYRQLRTNLHFLSVSRETKSVVVTSPAAGDGKTTTAINLAISLALAGSRVALVDADLRRPDVARHLGLDGDVGLTTVLADQVALQDVLQPWGESGGLMVLASGQIPPNPSELLASAAMEKLLAELEAAFDIVVFDGAPVLPVTDSAVLAGITDGALLVAASGRTTQSQLDGATAALHAAGARQLGVVLTMLPGSGSDAYAPYGAVEAPKRRPGHRRRERPA